MAVNGSLQLCEYVIQKTTNKNPLGNFTMINFSPFKYEIIKEESESTEENLKKFNFKATPLHIAAVNGNLDLYKLIMNNVDEVNPETNNGKTPLHMAVTNGHMELSKMIIERIENKNPSDR